MQCKFHLEFALNFGEKVWGKNVAGVTKKRQMSGIIHPGQQTWIIIMIVRRPLASRELNPNRGWPPEVALFVPLTTAY